MPAAKRLRLVPMTGALMGVMSAMAASTASWNRQLVRLTIPACVSRAVLFENQFADGMKNVDGDERNAHRISGRLLARNDTMPW